MDQIFKLLKKLTKGKSIVIIFVIAMVINCIVYIINNGNPFKPEIGTINSTISVLVLIIIGFLSFSAIGYYIIENWD